MSESSPLSSVASTPPVFLAGSPAEMVESTSLPATSPAASSTTARELSLPPFLSKSLSEISEECNELCTLSPCLLTKRLGHYYRLELSRRVRWRLIKTIETTTGRKVCDKHEAKNFKAHRDHPSRPNCYEWRFTGNYPAFPDKVLSQFSLLQVKECNEALDRAWVYVVDVSKGAVGEGSNGGPFVERNRSGMTRESESNYQMSRSLPRKSMFESPEPIMTRINDGIFPKQANGDHVDGFNGRFDVGSNEESKSRSLKGRQSYQGPGFEPTEQVARIRELEKMAEEYTSARELEVRLRTRAEYLATELGRWKVAFADLKIENKRLAEQIRILGGEPSLVLSTTPHDREDSMGDERKRKPENEDLEQRSKKLRKMGFLSPSPAPQI